MKKRHGFATLQSDLWMESELARCRFKDARHGKRLRKLLKRLCENIGGSIPWVCQDWANTKAAYPFSFQRRGVHVFLHALESARQPEMRSDEFHKGGLPVHIFHFKMAGKRNWGKIGQMTALIQAARDRGLDITADQYPYTAGQTGLALVLPAKYTEGTTEQIIDRLKDPRVRDEIRKAIETGPPGWENFVQAVGGWHGVMISSVQKPEHKQYEGKRMDEVAKEMGKDPLDAVCDLLISEEMRVDAIYFEDDEQDVRVAMREPWVDIGSDAEATNPDMRFMGRVHPRYYGNFPRVLGYYVREQKVLTLPDAIRKMTSLPAQIIGLTDRGILRPGMAADITIFDPEKVADKATYEDPFQYPVGVPYVIVNGTVVIDQAKHTGALPGRVLYGRGKSAGKTPAVRQQN